jgi:hypothetical protein
MTPDRRDAPKDPGEELVQIQDAKRAYAAEHADSYQDMAIREGNRFPPPRESRSGRKPHSSTGKLNTRGISLEMSLQEAVPGVYTSP